MEDACRCATSIEMTIHFLMGIVIMMYSNFSQPQLFVCDARASCAHSLRPRSCATDGVGICIAKCETMVFECMSNEYNARTI